uniref:Uncharacterized protein n=1 Tax=Haptolina brevifila TaxID=156173 RepID=A0A7S2H064_9EUKA|mmetsp:Transcript_4966/g.10528  ORF Transcript_4966/g.10528 Transcript_4966/m.10528 type:complete len:350 (+) Transcript_4966:82-1131(+)
MAISKISCYQSLWASELNFTDFQMYNKFFMNDSVITLSQAGSFSGPQDISEYVSFASYASSYFETSSTLPGDDFALHSIDQDHGTCTFDVKRASFYTFSAPAFARASAWVAYGLRLTLEQRSAAFISAYVYYPVPTMRLFFESFFNTAEMLNFVCSTFKQKCSAQWAQNHWNESTPIDVCTTELARLPMVEGNLAYFNQKTRGCRILHADFAAKDSFHCPHLSFVPVPDGKGHLICQPEETRTTPHALGFDAAFINGLDAFAASRGINTATGSNVQQIACNADGDCPTNFTCEANGDSWLQAQMHYWAEQAKYALRYPLQALRFGGHPTLFKPSSSRSICHPAQAARVV